MSGKSEGAGSLFQRVELDDDVEEEQPISEDNQGKVEDIVTVTEYSLEG